MQRWAMPCGMKYAIFPSADNDISSVKICFGLGSLWLSSVISILVFRTFRAISRTRSKLPILVFSDLLSRRVSSGFHEACMFFCIGVFTLCNVDVTLLRNIRIFWIDSVYPITLTRIHPTPFLGEVYRQKYSISLDRTTEISSDSFSESIF